PPPRLSPPRGLARSVRLCAEFDFSLSLSVSLKLSLLFPFFPPCVFVCMCLVLIPISFVFQSFYPLICYYASQSLPHLPLSGIVFCVCVCVVCVSALYMVCV